MPKKSKLLKVIGSATAGLALAAGSANAQVDDLYFAGFATIAYGQTLSDRSEGTIRGLSEDGEWRDLNQVGFRMDADLGDDLTFTAQVAAEGKSEYDPDFDWLYAEYQLNDEWSLALGRSRAPVFMYSDFLDVSYAYQWIEPPSVVYADDEIPFKSFEGPKLTWNRELIGWDSELLLFVGRTDDEFKSQGVDSSLIIDDMHGAAWTVSRDWLSLRAFYVGGDVSVDITTNPTLNGLVQLIAGLEQAIAVDLGTPIDLQTDLLMEEDPGDFYGLGMHMDFDRFYLQGEATRIEVDSNLITPDMDSYYLSAGVRLPKNVTVAVTYGIDENSENKGALDEYNQAYLAFQGGLATSTYLSTPIPGVGAPGATINPIVMDLLINNLQNSHYEKSALSVRWDFHSTASMKAEYLSFDQVGRTGLTALIPGIEEETNPRAVRVGIDLVF